jgi:hypothetical protein
MEAIVATVIATIAILGLAYSFGQGRSFIDRFEVARVALGVAQARMERLSFLPLASDSLEVGAHPASPNPFVFDGRMLGTESWRVETADDPFTAETDDMKRVTVTVTFATGSVGDSVVLKRLFRRDEI